MTEPPTKFYIVAEVPKGFELKFMQHMRDFDTTCPECFLTITGDCSNVTVDEAAEFLGVHPEVKISKIFFERKK